jgi:hypothetical protein
LLSLTNLKTPALLSQNMKKLLLISAMFIVCQSCTQSSSNAKDDKPKSETAKNDNLKNYVITFYQDKFDESAGKFTPNNVIDSVQADNDTAAYLTALKRYYNQKIIERKNLNYGQPKSFLVVDKNGVDLKVNLSDKVVNGLKNQVENTPDVKRMIEEYKRDSL